MMSRLDTHGIYDDVIVHNFFIIFCCFYSTVILRVLTLGRI